MDAGYGCNTDHAHRRQCTRIELCGRHPANTSVWPSGMGPLPPKKWSGQGRPPKLIRRDDKHRPISVKQLALDLPNRAWAHNQVAGRYDRVALLALCARARSGRTSRFTISPTVGRKNGC